MLNAGPDDKPTTTAPRSRKPRFIDALYAPPLPPTWANWALACLYGFTAVACPLAVLVSGNWTESVVYALWFGGGAAIYAAWCGFGAWRIRPLPDGRQVPAWTLIPVFVHALCGSLIGAWLLRPGPAPDDSVAGFVGNLAMDAAFLAVLLGWIPGLVLLRFARGASVLVGAGVFGCLWLASMFLEG